MKLTISLLLIIILFRSENSNEEYLNASNRKYETNIDTTCFKLKKVNIGYMLRGYFNAASSIEDKEALGGFGGSGNVANKIDKISYLPIEDKLSLFVDTTSCTELGDGYQGQNVYLINKTGNTLRFEASDSRLSIIAEAFYNDVWQPIEYLPSSWCGNSYHKVYLKDNEYWRFVVPRYSGRLKVKLRYRFEAEKERIYYSNEINSSVNKKQFSVKQGYSSQGLMDPYID